MVRPMSHVAAAVLAATAALPLAACTPKKVLESVQKEQQAPQPPPPRPLALSPEAKILVDRVVALSAPSAKGTSTVELDVIMKDYVGDWETREGDNAFKTFKAVSGGNDQPPDLKLYVAQLQVLRALKSVVWRASGIFLEAGPRGQIAARRQDLRDLLGMEKPVVLPSDEKERISHNAALTAMRAMFTSILVLAPDSPAKTAFTYVVEPSAEAAHAGYYASVQELQDDLFTKLVGTYSNGNLVTSGALSRLLITLSALKGTVNDENPIAWDPRLAFGVNAFEGNAQTRQEMVGDLELDAIIASTRMAIHDVMIACAFNYDDLPEFGDDFATLIGLKGLGTARVDGQSVRTFVELIREFRTKDRDAEKLFDLRKGEGLSDGAAHLKIAYQDYLLPAIRGVDGEKVRIRGVREIYEASKQRSRANAPRGIFVNEWLTAAGIGRIENDDANGGNVIDSLDVLVSGRASLKSPVTGEVATFNLPAFYLTPPKDLTVFLPVDFYGEGDAPKLLQASDGTKEYYHNYAYGRAKSWSSEIDAYLPPQAGPGPDTDRVQRAARVLATNAFSGINNPVFALRGVGGAQ